MCLLMSLVFSIINCNLSINQPISSHRCESAKKRKNGCSDFLNVYINNFDSTQNQEVENGTLDVEIWDNRFLLNDLIIR